LSSTATAAEISNPPSSTLPCEDLLRLAIKESTAQSVVAVPDPAGGRKFSAIRGGFIGEMLSGDHQRR